MAGRYTKILKTKATNQMLKDEKIRGQVYRKSREIFELKKYKSEVIQLQNLVDGYKKVITELTEIINKK